MSSQIDTLLSEQRRFPPTPAFAKDAHGKQSHYDQAAHDRLEFWSEQAKSLVWMTPWESVLDWTPPHAKWFTGGRLNVAANCIDRHLSSARRNKAAIIWEGEPGDRRVYT